MLSRTAQYRFGAFEVDSKRRELRRGPDVVDVQPRRRRTKSKGLEVPTLSQSSPVVAGVAGGEDVVEQFHQRGPVGDARPVGGEAWVVEGVWGIVWGGGGWCCGGGG